MKPYVAHVIRSGFGLGITLQRIPFHRHNKGRGRSYRLYLEGHSYQLELQLLLWYIVLAVDVKSRRPLLIESGKKEAAA